MNILQLQKSKLIAFAVVATLLLSVLSVAHVSAAPGKSEAAKAAKPSESSIVEIVLKDDGEFDVLQAAVIEAGLVSTLNGNRQYTVFAPTDQAFIQSLGVNNEAQAIQVVQSLPKDVLTDILLYHVTSGRRTSTSVLAAPSYSMLNGDKLPKSVLASAGIVSTDISARNGVVHVINSVLMP